MNQPLKEGEDYYCNDKGLVVMTAAYLLKRGFCCGNGCLNCPYAYINVPEPKKAILLAGRNKNQQS